MAGLGISVGGFLLRLLAATLAVGLSSSLVKRRVTGQVDDTDTE